MEDGPRTPGVDGSRRHRVFFVHVMKTGGTTLLTSFRRNYAREEIYPDPTLDMPPDAATRVAFRHLTMSHLRSLPAARRSQLRLVAGHFPYAAREILGREFRAMTLLRHPVDRTISLLRQLQRPATWIEGQPASPMRTLSLEEIYEQPHVYEPLVHDHQTKLFSLSPEDEPTGYMQVLSIDRSRLERAKETLEEIDVVGLTERYDEFLDVVTDRFGWTVNRSTRANEAPGDAEAASTALRRRIQDDNAIDVELYEHAVELVVRRARA